MLGDAAANKMGQRGPLRSESPAEISQPVRRDLGPRSQQQRTVPVASPKVRQPFCGFRKWSLVMPGSFATSSLASLNSASWRLASHGRYVGLLKNQFARVLPALL
jgi:hypothetical protein